MKKTLFVSFAAVFCLAVAGCNSATEPTTKVAGLDKPADPPKMPDLGHGAPRSETDQMYNLWLAPGVASICSGPSPFFSFDSSKPDTESQPTMQNLVDCMRTGPLQGKSIILIGRTDPRGSDDYNIKLGRDRAEQQPGDRKHQHEQLEDGEIRRVVADERGDHGERQLDRHQRERDAGVPFPHRHPDDR